MMFGCTVEEFMQAILFCKDNWIGVLLIICLIFLAVDKWVTAFNKDKGLD